MNRKKVTSRICSLALAILMAMGALPQTVFAAGETSTDGKITAVEVLEDSVKNREVSLGISLEDLKLPKTLKATVAKASAEISVNSWTAEPEYAPDTVGKYTFTPVLETGYTLAEDVSLPTISVTVLASQEENGGEKETSVIITIDPDEPLYLSESEPITDADLLAGVVGEDENGESVDVTVQSVDGLDRENPAHKEGFEAYTITYEAKHPMSEEVFTVTREAYVTVGIMMLADGDISIDETNFPDANFRTWLLAQTYGSDGILTLSEIATIQYMGISNQGIVSLEGIKYFTSLTSLDADNNPLESLDVSGMTSLKYLYVWHSNDQPSGSLESLDVSGCTSLLMLDCFNNSLTSLDVSDCTLLQELYCNWNQIESLDVSNFTSLTKLYCNVNKLENLDVSGCTNLSYLTCSDNMSLTELDVSNLMFLEELYCWTPGEKYPGPLQSLNVSNCNSLRKLDCFNQSLNSLDLTDCALLETLNCAWNNISTVTLAEPNQNLTILRCYQNQIREIDVSVFPNLQELNISYNQLESLDVSELNYLNILNFNDNPIEHLKLADGKELTVKVNPQESGKVILHHENNNLFASDYYDAYYITLSSEAATGYLYWDFVGDIPDDAYWNGLGSVSFVMEDGNKIVTAEFIAGDAYVPMFTWQLWDAMVETGDPVTLYASAYVSDGGTLSYQWYKNTTNSPIGGILISAATSASYTPDTNTVGTLYYYCVVTNTNTHMAGNQTATATSNVAEVKVIDKPTVDSISVPAVKIGETLSLTAPAIVDNGAAVTAQGWEISTDGGTNWETFDSATFMTYAHNGQYLRYYATNSAGTAYSNTMQLTVNKLDLTLFLSCADITYGGTLTPVLSGNTGGGSVTYEYKVQGADNVAYSTTVPTDADDYTVRASVAATDTYNAVSVTADFRIEKATPTIQANPSVNGANMGKSLSTVSLSELTAGGVDGAVLAGSFAWQNPQTVVPRTGKQTAIFTPTDTVNYNSITFEVQVNLDTTKPVIESVQATPSLNSAKLKVSATAGTPLTYQWQVKGSWIDIPGAISAVFDYTGLSADTEYTVRVIVTDANGNSTTSEPVTFKTGKQVVSGLPGDVTITDGNSVTWTPNPPGGTWDYDSDFLSMSEKDGTVTFTAKKTGKTTVKYTVSGTEQVINITVVESMIPKTGDSSNMSLWIGLLCISLSGITGMAVWRKKRKAASESKRTKI